MATEDQIKDALARVREADTALWEATKASLEHPTGEVDTRIVRRWERAHTRLDSLTECAEDGRPSDDAVPQVLTVAEMDVLDQIDIYQRAIDRVAKMEAWAKCPEDLLALARRVHQTAQRSLLVVRDRKLVKP